MTVTALIAEDEPVLAQALATMLGRLWPELRLLPIAEDGGQALDMALDMLPDVLFLDIQMPERNGLEVAEMLADQWPDDRPLPRIVFVTAYDEYAVAAFERAAVDYVLKPVQSSRLATTCDRLRDQLSAQSPATPAAQDVSLLAALQALQGAQGAQAAAGQGGAQAQPLLKVIQVAMGAGLQLVPVDDVLYFEAADKYVRIVTAQRDAQAPELLIRTPLRELIPRLDGEQFWQVHRSVVVNVRAIEQVSRVYGRLRVHVRGRPETLEVSRMYAHLFKAM